MVENFSIALKHPNMSYGVKAALNMPTGSNLSHDASLETLQKLQIYYLTVLLVHMG